jgi:protoporphyrinogen oxidase
MPNVTIIGGGVTGLAVAHALCRFGGHDVTVAERSAQTGGLAGSVSFGDLELDVGSHRIHPKAHPDALALVRELLGDDLLVRPRRGQIRFRGRWLAYPPSLVELALSYSPASLTVAAGSWVSARVRRRRRGMDTFEDVLTHKFGRRLFEDFYSPYARKLWGLEPRKIAAVAAEQRAQRLSLARVLGDVRRWVTSSAAPHTFLYPAGGFAQVARRLEEHVEQRGVKILRRTSAESLCFRNGASRATGVRTVSEPDQRPATLAADWVVSTAPLHFNLSLLARSGRPALSPPPALRFRHLRIVFILARESPAVDAETLYVPGSETRFGRISFPLRYRADAAPRAGFPVVIEAPCSPDDETWRLDDASLVSICRDDLLALGVFERLTITASQCLRVPCVYPVYEVGWENELRRAAAYQDQVDNFIPVGRTALFLHCNIDHCLAMGAALGKIIAGSANPHHDWAALRRRFSDFTPHE